MMQAEGPSNDCSQKLCLNDCSARGTCHSDGTCGCKLGFSSEDCSFKNCPNDCTDQGVCEQPDGACKCFPGFVGTDCSEDECPNRCSGHGTCDSGCCSCDDGFTGIDCSLMQCPQDCNRRGTCDYTSGSCVCFSPYFGEACEKVPPPQVVIPESEETAEPEPLPPPYIEPHHVYGRLLFGSECSSDEEWRSQNGQSIIDSIAKTAQVSSLDVELHDINCQYVAPEGYATPRLAVQTPASAMRLLALQPSLHVHVEYRVAAQSEEEAALVRERLDSALSSGAMLADLSNQGLEFDGLKSIADPLVVRPGEEFQFVPSKLPSPSSSPAVSPGITPSSTPSVSPSPELSASASMEPLPEEPPLPPGTLEAEVKSAIDLEMVFDMPYTTAWTWQEKYQVALRQVLATFVPFADGFTRIRLSRVYRGTIGSNDRAVAVHIVVSPPETSDASENSLKQKMKIEEGISSGDLLDEFVKAGVEDAKGLRLIRCDVRTQPITDKLSRCKRCRNGREQAENDHREFTRKCNRGGSCRRPTEFSIQDACAHGCADHCSSTCRRFHDPKARTCTARRRMYRAAEALSPSKNSTLNATTLVADFLEVDEDMRHFIRKSVDEQDLLSIDVAREGSEVAVISVCFSECARSCIETCIGQWSDDIPDPELTVEALEKVEHAGQAMLVQNSGK